MRRVLRWLGWAVAVTAGLVVVAVLVVPWLWPFTSSGTLEPAEAARASLGAEPRFEQLAGIEVHVERHPAATTPPDGAQAGAGGAEAGAAGQPEPPLIVVLHGFGANVATWRGMLPALAELGEVVAYDRPPFGFSERPEVPDDGVDPYGTDGQLELLSAVIERFRGEDPDRAVVLLGHSAGGALAAEHALRRPDEVDALVLVAPAVLTTGGAPGWLAPVLRSWPVDRWGPRLAGVAASGADRLLEVSWHDPTRLDEDLRARYDEPRQVAGWEQGLWRLVQAPAALQVGEDPGALTLPVLLITGDDDRVVPTADTRELAALIDGAQLEVLPATGHVPHEESPDAFLDAVVDGWPLPGG